MYHFLKIRYLPLYAKLFAASGALSYQERVVGSAVSSSVTSHLLVYPLEVVKRRMQAGGEQYNNLGVTGVLRKVVATDGIRGLYAGWFPTLLKAVPCIAISLSIRDVLSHSIKKRIEDQEPVAIPAG